MSGAGTVLIMVLIYLGIVLYTGVRAGKGREKNMQEFVAAGGSLNLFIMYFLMGGAIFSAFAFLGGPGWAFSRGAAAFYILAYCALGLLPWLIWGPRSHRIGRRYNYLTQAGLVSDRFESSTLSAIMAVVSILAFIQYIALQLKGMAYVLNVTTDGLIPFWLGALIAYGVVLIYVLTSGIRGVGWTNVIQSIMMISMAWILGLWLPFKFHGGIGPMFQKIAEMDPTHLVIGKPQMSWAAFSTAIIVSVLGFTMWPHLFMKSFATREKTIKRTVMMYPTFAIFMVPVLFIGFSGIGVIADGVLDSADQILPTMLMRTELHPLILGIFAAATLAAAMSSSDTITHGAASVYTMDFHKKVINTDMSEEKSVTVTRIAIVIFVGVAYYIAVFGAQTLVALLLGAYGSIVQFLPLVAATFFWERATKYGAIWGLITGVAVNTYFQIFAAAPFEIHAGLWGLIANIIVFVAVSYMTEAHDKQHVEKFTKGSSVPLDRNIDIPQQTDNI